MRGAILVVMLALAVFVFGCTGQGSGSVNTSVQGNNGAQAGQNTGTTQPMANTSTSGSTSGTTMVNTSGTTSGGTSGSANASTSGSSDLTGKGYAALLALGVPIQCQITTTSNGTTITINAYMDGKGDVRMEVPNQNSGSSTCTGNMAVITSSTKMDMGCVGSQMFQGCDWLEIPLNVSGSGSTSGGTSASGSPSQTPDLTNVPATQFSCQPWILDSSKFTTSGKVCSMQDLINGMGAGAGAGAGTSYGR